MDKPLRATFHCRHYAYENTGLAGWRAGNHGGPLCARGVDLRTEPGAARACMPPDGATPPPCPQREEFTAEERAVWRDWVDARVTRAVIIMAAIPQAGFTGSLTCPACGIGTVRWSRALNNGHLAADCSTPNCFSVIQ